MRELLYASVRFFFCKLLPWNWTVKFIAWLAKDDPNALTPDERAWLDSELQEVDEYKLVKDMSGFRAYHGYIYKQGEIILIKSTELTQNKEQR